MFNTDTIIAQDDFSINGFIDEDGDGFNDLIPDSDGDGVPDPLDPDFKGNHTDTSYMQQYLHSHGNEHQFMWQHMNENMMGNMMDHGEPGMYGPGDSTMHGGHQGGGHHGGGMDPGGGMGPGEGGGMGPGPDGNMNDENNESTDINDAIVKDPIIPLLDDNINHEEKVNSENQNRGVPDLN